ncbi:MAG: aminoacyl-histidine dipeptidase [Calditrichia bacterium]
MTKIAIEGLKPALLWEHFYGISQIPRPSKDEERVSKYVIGVAERNGFEYRLDAVKNIVVRKPATPGMENTPVVILQSHLDMVCEKNKDTVHDFDKDPIRLLRDGDWITADGTTLGADNGIGVAAALAVMDSKDVAHGPMEFLFTIDEETGLTGAIELGEDMLEGRVLLNMDSEEDGAMYIGCAGGRDTVISFPLKTEMVPSGYAAKHVRIGGLLGGHSGLQISSGLGNGLKLLTRFLHRCLEDFDVRLAHIDGGSMRNAIPRECDAVIYIPLEKDAAINEIASEFDKVFKDELKLVDADVFLRLEESGFNAPQQVFAKDLQTRLLNMLYGMPHGVLAMSQAVPGLVETSTNLAVIKTHDDHILVHTSQRGSVASGLQDAVNMVSASAKLAQADIRYSNGYPGWEPNPDSKLLHLAKGVHEQRFGKAPEILAIHAGLECGIIGAKFPGMDMVSFGPTITGAHSPDEQVQISTVERFWDFLVGILEAVGKK